MEALRRSGMEGSVSPPVEVDPGEDAGLAGNPGVDLVVRQHHRVHLQVFHVQQGMNEKA